MKLTKNDKIFGLLLVLIYFFETFEMFGTEEPTAMYNYTIYTLFGFCLITTFFMRRVIKEPYSSAVLMLAVSMYAFSMVMISQAPFPAKIYYLTNLMPVFVLLGSLSCYNQPQEGNELKLIGVLLLALIVYYFQHYQQNMIIEITTQNIASYTILYFTPFILCVRNNKYKIIGMLVIALVVLTSLKRGGILALGVGFISYFLFEFLKNNSSKKRQAQYIAIFVLILAGLFYIYTYLEQVTDNALSGRFLSLENDEGSGRMDTWSWVFSDLRHNSFFDWIFGHGWNAVKNNNGIRSAHNDFLEILYDFGIIVFALYIILYKRLFGACVKLLKNKSIYAAPLFCSTMMLLVNSLVSHVVFYPKYMVIYCLFWAYVDVKTKNELIIK